MNFIYIKKNILAFFSIALISAVLCVSLAGCSFFESLFSINVHKNTDETGPATNSVSAEAVETSFSYESINDDAVKNLYLQIDGMASQSKPTEIKCLRKLREKEMYQALNAYKNDHPEVFWLKNSFVYYDLDEVTYITYEFTTTEKELIEEKQRFNSVIDSILRDAPMYSSEYERELYANNYLIDNCVYDEEAADDHEVIAHENDAYGAIVDGKAVCEGYSRAFQLLCNKMGLDCVCIAGIADEIGHEWNCVKVDGEWYQVDVTWNDHETPACVNDYLNLTDAQMYADHKPDATFDKISDETYLNDSYIRGNLFLPECTATENNFYVKNYPTLTDFDYENDIKIAQALVDDAMADSEEFFSIVIDESLDFDEACDKLIDEGYVVEYFEKANDINDYELEIDPTQCKAYQKEGLRVVTFTLSYV